MQDYKNYKIAILLLKIRKLRFIILTQGKFTLTQIYHSFFSSSRREAKCE
nr:MAG TPA: hypothetical protein [Caudoviricetes sp.]